MALTFNDDCDKVIENPLVISFKRLCLAIRDPRLQRPHRRVLVHLMERLNYQTGTAFPGRKSIAEGEELSIKSVENACYDLRSWGYLAWMERPAPNVHRGRLLHYTLPVARWSEEEIKAGIEEFLKKDRAGQVPVGAGSCQDQLPPPAGSRQVPARAGSKAPLVPARAGDQVPALAGDSNLLKELAKRESARTEKCASGKSSKTRLPADWTCPPEWRAYAQSKGAAEFQIDFLEDAFRGYWLSGDAAGGGLKVDWKGTWENWVRREIARGGLPRSAPKVGANGALPQRPTGMSDAAWQIRLAELAKAAA